MNPARAFGPTLVYAFVAKDMSIWDTHWLYWAGLIVFPAIALYLVRRQLRNPLPAGPSLFIAYLFWLTSGFMGIHRFYLRSALGFVFIPVFLAILYCNAEVREVRDETSRTFAALEQAHTTVFAQRVSIDRCTCPHSTISMLLNRLTMTPNASPSK